MNKNIISCVNMEEEIKFDLVELEDLEADNGRKYDYVRLSVSDMNGVCRTNVVPRRHLNKNLTDGFFAFSGQLTCDPRANVMLPKELKEINLGNCECFPCKGTLHNCPWVALNDKNGLENRVDWLVGEVLCELRWPLHYRGGAFVEASPRFVLRKQLNRLNNLGYILMSAFEMEYTLLHSDTLNPVFPGKDAGATQIHAKFENYLYTIERNCEKAGLDISALRVEHGPGQFEMVMEPRFGVKTSDDVTILKGAIKEMSASLGYLATFMSLPSKHLSTNGFHLNLSLWKCSPDGTKTNAFYDATDPDNMSSIFRHFLAGLIKHGKSLTAFCCPTINCYSRLHEFLTPHKINWGIDNRLAAFRVKKGGASSTYLENRIPSSACNPYLATAATIASGLDGILNQIPLPDKFNVEIDPNNCMEAMKEEGDKDKLMPYSLEESLDELEKDEALKESLGEELVKWFVLLKRKTEVDVVKTLKTNDRWQKERELFLEFI